MWKQMTTSKMQEIKQEFESKIKQDTGLLKLGPKRSGGGGIVTEDRLRRILPLLEMYYELWLSYPDKLVSLLVPIDTAFKLFPFQTLGLRANLRHKFVFQTATRGKIVALTHFFQ